MVRARRRDDAQARASEGHARDAAGRRGRGLRPGARQGAVPIEFHFDDGSSLDGALILTTAELERLYAQTSRLLDAHERALGGTP
ncbi:hypothetical protein [Streptomyces sp. NPDC015350]|uniref:hypothetical protein n=1 Tax=Streptomyces sp. NPDC015350 TaxID=3364955 RepID=UPI00370338C4